MPTGDRQREDLGHVIRVQLDQPRRERGVAIVATRFTHAASCSSTRMRATCAALSASGNVESTTKGDTSVTPALYHAARRV
jgi:hypothetical protein